MTIQEVRKMLEEAQRIFLKRKVVKSQNKPVRKLPKYEREAVSGIGFYITDPYTNEIRN